MTFLQSPKSIPSDTAIRVRMETAGFYLPKTQQSGEKTFYHQDHLGSTNFTTDAEGNITGLYEYYPYGKERLQPAKNPFYKHTNHETDPESSLVYSVQRYRDTVTGQFLSYDPLADMFPGASPYSYTANNPLKYIDPDGEAWEPVSENGRTSPCLPCRTEQYPVPTGFRWIPEAESYNSDGVLKDGLYHQAIFFTENGTFDATENFNMGSSTAYVYRANGSVVRFRATTYPADPQRYFTILEGFFEAKVGLHKGNYPALRIGDLGTIDFSNNKIYLPAGQTNPYNGNFFGSGINSHKAGGRNTTGIDSGGNAVSMGCPLIDIEKWNEYISIFDNDAQRDNVVGIAVSRSYSAPIPIDF